MHIAITGASSGIGEALAREFGKENKLTLVARRKDLLEKLAAEVGSNARIEAVDLSDEAACAAWVQAAEAAHGPIDILINNAGMENTGPTSQTDLDKAWQLMRLNLFAPIRLIHTLLPQMLARKSGAIVNVVSMAAITPIATQSWYSGSKGGLANFSEALHYELLGSGVHVLTVYPGPVKTAMADSAYAAFGGRKGIVGAIPEGNTEALAKKIRSCLQKKKARLVYPYFYVAGMWFPNISRWFSNRFSPRPYKANEE
jgi:short-subunit dehydrogenase